MSLSNAAASIEDLPDIQPTIQWDNWVFEEHPPWSIGPAAQLPGAPPRDDEEEELLSYLRAHREWKAKQAILDAEVEDAKQALIAGISSLVAPRGEEARAEMWGIGVRPYLPDVPPQQAPPLPGAPPSARTIDRSPETDPFFFEHPIPSFGPTHLTTIRSPQEEEKQQPPAHK